MKPLRPMKPPTLLAFVGAALLLAAGSQAAPPPGPAAHAETPAYARREIARLYRIADSAYDERDAEAQLALLAPGFVVLDEKGNKATLAQIAPAIRKLYERNRAIKDTRTYTKTTLTSIQVSGSHAAVLWKGHQEAVSRTQYAVADVQDESTGEDHWIRTPAGWRMQRQQRLTFHRSQRGGITPEALRDMQQVHQAHQLLNQVIAGEQASDDQQQQMRAEEERQRRHKDAYGY